MTSISTDGQTDSPAPSLLMRRASDQAFTLTFLVTSAVATVGWFYALAQAAVAVTNWLFL
jgi:hypothetical protein